MYKIYNKGFQKASLMLVCMTLFLASCDFGFELPETNSIPDATPPSAAFEFKASDGENFLTINFTNLSGSATDYEWDFGDGNMSTDQDPSYTYEEVGTYNVSLTALDKKGASSTVTKEVVVEEVIVEFVPVILEADFEDNSLPDGTGDGRDSWRNDAGGVIQITSSPVYSGDQAAKLPSAGDRVGQQSIAVLANTDYRLSFYYTMKSDPGTLTVAILDSEVSDLSEVPGATIAALELTDNSDANTYVNEVLAFNSGENTVVTLIFFNEGSECRVDAFEFLD